ncbi:FabD lysophospholipase-like protein [Mycena belliarum]|uniref:FabD lysophospholipase-like protein n=1 Tax=Mycena belliarum TaxID=1033014 RepID=A0AAD6U8G8_9AGAR|nr:FabD lysophospholipase-like protein [Mycena belliae]
MGVRLLSLGNSGLNNHFPDSLTRHPDGGEALTISHLRILERIMYQIKQEDRLKEIPLPCDYFELICGSGIGGIIALLLARHRMSVKDATNEFLKLKPEKTIGEDQFSTSKFEKTLQHIFNTEEMEDTSPDRCNVFVCAMRKVNMNAGSPQLFRSYGTRLEPVSDCMIWEAARATSATPGLFKSMAIGLSGLKQEYVGGDLCCKNPTLLILEEANLLFPGRPATVILSLGSGHARTIGLSKKQGLDKVTKAIATDSQRTHQEVQSRLHGIPCTYIRLNVQQGIQDLVPHDWDQLGTVCAQTDNYLRGKETEANLKVLVKAICNPQVTAVQSGTTAVHLKVCPAPNIRFTGRHEILKSLGEYFDKDPGKRHIALLHGLGGAGKSQIAFKFVAECADMQRFCEIYFIDSTSHQTIETDLATIAQVRKVGATAEDCLLWLAARRTNYLLVYNNADDVSLNLGQYFPGGSGGNILITSRNPKLCNHADFEHKVGQMELKDAIDLLLMTARYDITIFNNREIAREIVQVLHSQS